MQPITENHSFDDVDFVFHDAQKQYNKCGEILRSIKIRLVGEFELFGISKMDLITYWYKFSLSL